MEQAEPVAVTHSGSCMAIATARDTTQAAFLLRFGLGVYRVDGGLLYLDLELVGSQHSGRGLYRTQYLMLATALMLQAVVVAVV